MLWAVQNAGMKDSVKSWMTVPHQIREVPWKYLPNVHNRHHALDLELDAHSPSLRT